MAPNKNKNTYEVKDLIKNVTVNETTRKPKIGYIKYVKSGGWKPICGVLGIMGLLGFVWFEMKERHRRYARMEARMIFEQGIKPEKQINKNLFKSEESVQFGQSSLKDDKLE